MSNAGDEWSAIADDWVRYWGRAADPVRHDLLGATGVRLGTRLLDAGCGSGELLRAAADLGAVVTGCDPAAGMLAHARRRVPEADLRRTGVEALPWAAASFDVVTAVNALQLADDPDAALREVRRVLAPGGRFGIANWAEAARNDIDVLERAAAEDDPAADDAPNRLPGGLEALLADAGFAVESAGLSEVVWAVDDDASLVAGMLLGEDPSVVRELGPRLLEAAAPFRTSSGGYRLRNRFRWAVGRT